jgi:hypothetical protein
MRVALELVEVGKRNALGAPGVPRIEDQMLKAIRPGVIAFSENPWCRY